jgi:hypothetical protein
VSVAKPLPPNPASSCLFPGAVPLCQCQLAGKTRWRSQAHGQEVGFVFAEQHLLHTLERL